MTGRGTGLQLNGAYPHLTIPAQQYLPGGHVGVSKIAVKLHITHCLLSCLLDTAWHTRAVRQRCISHARGIACPPSSRVPWLLVEGKRFS